MDLINALYKRKSIRKYSREKLSENLLSQIKEIIDDTDRLDAGIALRHAALAADHLSKVIKFKDMNPVEQKSLNYIITMEEI